MASEPPSSQRDYQDALYRALETSTSAVRDASPIDQLTSLVEDASRLSLDDPASLATLSNLRSVCGHNVAEDALQLAAQLFETPDEFREAIYFVRWLTRSRGQALRLASARRYTATAVVPLGVEIAGGEPSVMLRWTTFTTLWPEPEKLDAATASLEIWRANFAAAYARAHQTFNRGLSLIVEGVDELSPRALAVEKLNDLRRLGPAVATAAIQQFRELERLFACSIDDSALLEALSRAPFCPECGFVMGSAPPVADSRRVRQAIERGLLTQQRRLAQRVVSRLLEQPSRNESERLARFVQVVQASDLTGLAVVLDDTILEFLREFLEPRASQENVMERLAGSFPEITLANLDAALAELRRLLAADVVAAGGLLRLDQGRDA